MSDLGDLQGELLAAQTECDMLRSQLEEAQSELACRRALLKQPDGFEPLFTREAIRTGDVEECRRIQQKHQDFIRQILEGRAELQKKLAESEAGAAAMREALEHIAKVGCMQYEDEEAVWCKKDGSAHSIYCPVTMARQGLKSDAGRELLGELAKLRQLCDGYPRLLDAQKLAYESSASGTETLHKLDAMNARATALEEAAQVAESRHVINTKVGVPSIAAAIRALKTEGT